MKQTGARYLPFDLPSPRQVDVEKGRTMKPISVEGFITIKHQPNSMRKPGDFRLREIVCHKCPSMVGGEASRNQHWTVYANSLADAFIKVNDHLESCHSEGACNEC